MAYTNPKPQLHDEEKEVSIPHQEKTTADYTQWESVYFAFVDVLGFKQTFDENRKNPSGEFAKSFKESFQYFRLLMNGARFADNDNQWNAGQTSDSLYFYTTRPDYLSAFIKIYSHFSLYAMSKDVFLRGGIAKGNLYVDKPHQFYGDSVIKAYLLENSVAKNPIIVIDRNTYDDLKNAEDAISFLVEELPPKRSYIKPFVSIDTGELQAFLKVSPSDLHAITDDVWTEINRNIEKNLERFEFDDKNYHKYAFLQKQLNDFQKGQNNH
jgi:hypothetical protein